MINGSPEGFVTFIDKFWFPFLLLAIWSIIWKGLALWRAAGRGEKKWFVFLLILNTAGILEIIYLFLFTGGFQSREIVKTGDNDSSQK